MNDYVPRILAWAKTQYPSHRLGHYHDEQHPQEVWRCCRQIVKRLKACQPGITLNLEVLHCAAALHDVGMSLPSWLSLSIGGVPIAFQTKEEQIATLATEQLRRFGAPDQFCHQVRAAIEGTSPEGELPTLEASILAAADLAATAGSWELFERNFQRLLREVSTLTGTEINPASFAAGSIRLLGQYLRRRINLTPAFYDPTGRSAWHLGTIRNLGQLAVHYLGQPTSVVDLCGDETPLALQLQQPCFAGVLYTTCGQDSQQRQQTQRALPDQYTNQQEAPPLVLALPDERRALSLPDQFANLLLVPVTAWYQQLHPAGLQPAELWRVVQTTGRVSFYSSTPTLLQPGVLRSMQPEQAGFHPTGKPVQNGPVWQVHYAAA